MSGQPSSAPARRRTPPWPLLAVVGCALPPLYGLWRIQGAPMEEGFMLVFPEMVLEGRVPNRDFLHLYGPGSLWVLAAVYAVFGVRLEVQRVVGLLQHLLIGLGVARLLRPWGPLVSGAGGAIAVLIIITPSGLSAMAWVGGVGLGTWAVAMLIEGLEADEGSRRRDRRLVAAGLLVGAALLYRLDLVLALGLPAGAVLLRLDARSRIRLLVATAVGCSPYLVHLAVAGPGNAIRGLVVEPVFELRGGRHLPLPPSTDRYDGFLQGAGALDEPPWPLPAPSGPRQLWLWCLALVAVGLVLLLAGLVRARRDGSRRMLAIALFAVGLFPQAFQRPDSTHLAWVSCVAFAVLPAAVLELWAEAAGRRARARPVLAVAAPVALLLVVAPYFTFRSYAEATAQSFGRRLIEGTIEHEGRRFPYKRPDAVAAVNEMLPVVDRLTEPGDRLIVGPGDLRLTPYSEAFLYYLLPELEVGTRYVEMDPGVANAPDSGLADELRAADVVILSTIRDDWNEPNDARVPGSDEPNQVLEEEFCLVEQFGDGPFDPERGLYELYLRC